jgi:hypothetical protein
MSHWTITRTRSSTERLELGHPSRRSRSCSTPVAPICGCRRPSGSSWYVLFCFRLFVGLSQDSRLKTHPAGLALLLG